MLRLTFFQATYLASTSRSSTAAMILGSAVQMVLLAGYPCDLQFWGQIRARIAKEATLIQRLHFGTRPLFEAWQTTYSQRRYGYLLARRASGNSQDIIPLPEGTTMNYLRERFHLARIQNRAWDALRSPHSSTESSKEFLERTVQPLEELQRWRDSIPASIGPPGMPTRAGNLQQVQLTDMHWACFQTVVAIQSAIFSHPALFSDSAVRDQAAVAVGECAGAARGMLTLAKRAEHEFFFVS